MKLPKDYESAKKLLDRAQCREKGKPVANNTRVIHCGSGDIGVCLHNTTVVKFSPNGLIRLDSGGRRTFTTRNRINGCVPFGRIRQKEFVWYYGVGTETWVFADGMTLWEREVVYGADLFTPTSKRDPFLNKVKGFARGFVAALRSGEIGPPDLGDCLFCRTWLAGGSDHLVSHVAESYYVPSLVVRILDESGASDCARDFVINAMRKTLNDNPWHGIGEKQTEKLIRRYVLRHTGYAV